MRKISKYLANEEKLTLKICCKTKKHLFLQMVRNYNSFDYDTSSIKRAFELYLDAQPFGAKLQMVGI